MPVFSFSFFAASRLHRQVRRALSDLPTTPPGLGPHDDAHEAETVGPRLWVSSLAAEALWLGSYQSTYGFSAARWSVLSTRLSEYGNLPLVRPLDVAPSQRSDDERLHDERPVVRAVLQLSRRRRPDELTIAEVAEASGRSHAELLAAFGDIDGLLIDVARQIYADGFTSETSPLQLHLDRNNLTMWLQGLEDERRVTAVHRLYAIAGVPHTADSRIRARARLLRAIDLRRPDHLALATAVLAVDGWQGAREVPAFYPRTLPRSVVTELRRLARVTR
ncbi:hypothetical protein ACFT5B_13470 [Luteimicrobium sp. NPDC057192]|uniref:hypothetical protein n=1 Tax=Luteimicrobium sp. NPDC057192 TaxID=3346042 RepID=UPI0036391813